jgi:hypothetical protein
VDLGDNSFVNLSHAGVSEVGGNFRIPANADGTFESGAVGGSPGISHRGANLKEDHFKWAGNSR